jgi:hypothetical protein
MLSTEDLPGGEILLANRACQGRGQTPGADLEIPRPGANPARRPAQRAPPRFGPGRQNSRDFPIPIGPGSRGYSGFRPDPELAAISGNPEGPMGIPRADVAGIGRIAGDLRLDYYRDQPDQDRDRDSGFLVVHLESCCPEMQPPCITKAKLHSKIHSWYINVKIKNRVRSH